MVDASRRRGHQHLASVQYQSRISADLAHSPKAKPGLFPERKRGPCPIYPQSDNRSSTRERTRDAVSDCHTEGIRCCELSNPFPCSREIDFRASRNKGI